MKKWYSGSDIQKIEQAMMTKSKSEIMAALRKIHKGSRTQCGKVSMHKDEMQVSMCPKCSSFSLALYAILEKRPDLIDK